MRRLAVAVIVFVAFNAACEHGSDVNSGQITGRLTASDLAGLVLTTADVPASVRFVEEGSGPATPESSTTSSPRTTRNAEDFPLAGCRRPTSASSPRRA